MPLLKDDGGKQRVFYTGSKTPGLPRPASLFMETLDPAEVLALVAQWGQSWKDKTATHEQRNSPDSPGNQINNRTAPRMLSRDGLLGGSDFGSLATAIEGARTLQALEREFDFSSYLHAFGAACPASLSRFAVALTEPHCELTSPWEDRYGNKTSQPLCAKWGTSRMACSPRSGWSMPGTSSISDPSVKIRGTWANG